MSGRPKEYDDTAVIDAAMDVFWTNGYEASSTQELCERTGLATNRRCTSKPCAVIRNWESRRRPRFSMAPAPSRNACVACWNGV